MTTGPGIVIVGASLAGAKAAQALRDEGFDGAVTLIGDERERPYERPPLSKEYLLGKAEREKAFVHDEGWYAEHDVDLRLETTVTAIDRSSQQVVVEGGDTVPYERLLLTTGSSPRRLDVPGAELPGVLYLRRIEDSDAIKAAYGSASSVAVIGGGWIGLETAAAARAAGLDVTILEYAELPLLRVLGREAAEIFAGLHRDHGVDLRVSVEVSGITGDDAATGVRLGDGSEVAADLVLVGVGITPNTGLAEAAGLDVDNGVLVDERLRTSDADIFAAGDVANAFHPALGRRLRVEHWANARRQGVTAAKSMLGQDVTYDRQPYFFSDQYDLGMEYTGYVDLDADGPVDFVVRGDLAKRELIGFWVSDGRVLAGMNVNVWDVTEDIEALVVSGRKVDAAQLVDPDVPLDKL
jgi:3-phenylpropionate/trans-cinnamate dioxygenase ferredoxin reductase subunit